MRTACSTRQSITTATTIGLAGTAAAGATVEVYRASRPAGSFGLPIEYLGSALAAPSGQWELGLTLEVDDLVTALQIAPNENTSELAANVTVTAAETASYVSLTPARLLDTRDGTGLSGPFSSGVARTFAVTGHAGYRSTRWP